MWVKYQFTSDIFELNFLMLRLFSGCKTILKPSRPYHVGIQWIVLSEHSQMSTHVPGFHSFFKFFASFCIGWISHQQHKGSGQARDAVTLKYFPGASHHEKVKALRDTQVAWNEMWQCWVILPFPISYHTASSRVDKKMVHFQLKGTKMVILS